MAKINWFYTKDRTHRSKWLCERFRSELRSCNSVLDVGCSEKAIKAFLPVKCVYTGIDIAGNPDLKINLDEVERLPFKDIQFDAVICADVLEHLENLHRIFDELCRITRRYLILTLPNPAYGLYRYIIHRQYNAKKKSDREGKFLKFYGLPLEKPIDRHRWFFGYTEAIDFITFRSKKNNLILESTENNLMHEKLSLNRKLILGILKRLNPDLAYRNIVFLLRRNSI